MHRGKDSNNIWHLVSYYPTISKCQSDSQQRLQLVELDFDGTMIVQSYFADVPRRICDECWQFILQSGHWHALITKCREDQVERQKEQERKREWAAKLAQGRIAVIVGKIVVVCDLLANEQDTYYICATSQDRQNFPGVTDISASSRYAIPADMRAN